MALPPAPSAPLRVWHSSYETVSAAALPVHYKLANGLASTLVRMEAAEQGCTEAIRLNAAGEVAETAGANVFWWKQDVLYTPALSCGVLEGSTRHAVLRLSPWKVEEGHWPLAVLREAEAVFITNVAMGVAPVAALLPEQWEWKKSVAIAEQIRDLVDQEMRDFCTHGF